MRRRPTDGRPSRSETKAPRLVGLAALLSVFAVVAPARAQFLVRPVNLAYLTQRADIIVQGRVTNVRYEGLPGYEHVPTVLVTLDVERMLRGPEEIQFTFRQFLLQREMRGAKRGYLVGQRLLLFLLSPSQYGLSGPIGHGQGRLHILRDARGEELIANEFGNAGLFKGVATASEQAGMSLGAEQLRTASTARGAVPLRDFEALVQHLMLLPRIE